MLFPMPISLFIKIRVFIVLLISVSVFGAAYRYIIEPLNSNGVISIFEHHHPFQVLLWAIVGGGMAKILSLILSQPYAKYMAPLALPAGLTAWAAMTGRMDQLLLDCPTAAERTELFHRMILDSMMWTGLILGGFFLVNFVTKRGKSGANPGQNDEILFQNMQKSKNSSRTAQPKGFLQSRPWLKGLMSVCLVGIISLLLLKVLAQSGRTDYRLNSFQSVQISTIPATKQIIFAVLVAFAAGVFAAHQLFAVPLWTFFFSPALVAIVAYGLATQGWALEPLAQSTSPVLLSSVSFAGILPVQYIGVGSLGVIAGYWLSIYTNQVRMSHSR